MTRRVRGKLRAVTWFPPALGALLFACSVLPAAGQQRPTTRPGAATPPAKWTAEQKEQYRWEQLIEFFGDELLENWSLRVRDTNANERATFKYLELWKYDLRAKKWVKIDEGPSEAVIVPPGEKPASAPFPDSQLLVELPIKVDEIGLYYVKWRINEKTDGGTFTRLGPSTVTKQVTTLPSGVPAGMMLTLVPLDKNNAERQLIPDPRYHTGQAAKATTQPAAKAAPGA